MEVLFPRTVAELLELAAASPDGGILAGGTDLLVKVRKTGARPPVLFSLERLSELQRIEETGEELIIGAGVTVQRLLDSEAVKTRLPALWHALYLLGSPPVRHSATLGGNLCTASPAGDSLPPLYVYESRVEIASGKGQRCLPVADFITGPAQTALNPGEILTKIRIPLPPPATLSGYYKVGRRKAMAISIASLAFLILRDELGCVEKIKLAWGSVGPVVMTLPAVDEFLLGKRLSPEVLRQAASRAAAAVKPIDDVRASDFYRRQLAGNLLMRLTETSAG